MEVMELEKQIDAKETEYWDLNDPDSDSSDD